MNKTYKNAVLKRFWSSVKRGLLSPHQIPDRQRKRRRRGSTHMALELT
jgi:hypothetical protein